MATRQEQFPSRPFRGSQDVTFRLGPRLLIEERPGHHAPSRRISDTACKPTSNSPTGRRRVPPPCLVRSVARQPEYNRLNQRCLTSRFSRARLNCMAKLLICTSLLMQLASAILLSLGVLTPEIVRTVGARVAGHILTRPDSPLLKRMFTPSGHALPGAK